MPADAEAGGRGEPGSGRRARPSTTGLDGILVVAKEPGLTSHDIVGLVRRLTGVRRVGHGGTLDPFAAGVLPVFLGHATRLVEYHLADEKEYRALVCFGAESTTDDLDGELSPADGPPPTRAAVEEALAAFRGELEQVPPDYSAVRIAGRRAYELARHGRKPELRPRTVTVHRLELVGWDGTDPTRPVATLEMRVSAGTYVRALARDLGRRLGSGAYLGALTRTASGPFRLTDAHPLDRLREALAAGQTTRLLLAPDAGLEAYPRLDLPAASLEGLARGQAVRLPQEAGRNAGSDPPPAEAVPGEGLVRVFDSRGRLAAIARRREGRLYPEKVFVAGGG